MLSDIAVASTTLTGRLGLLTSSFCTSNSAGDGQRVGSAGWRRSSAAESGGIHSGENPLSWLVWTFMPCFTAVASTYGLNEEPTWLRDWSALSS